MGREEKRFTNCVSRNDPPCPLNNSLTFRPTLLKFSVVLRKVSDRSSRSLYGRKVGKDNLPLLHIKKSFLKTLKHTQKTYLIYMYTTQMKDIGSHKKFPLPRQTPTLLRRKIECIKSFYLVLVYK